MAGLAARIDRARQRLQVVQDRLDAGLRRIGAIAVGAAAGDRLGRVGRRIAGVIAVAVAVLGVPVVGAGRRIRILDLIAPCPASGVAGETPARCSAARPALPLPSLNQIASPWPNMMWFAPVPPLTDWWKLSLIAYLSARLLK